MHKVGGIFSSHFQFSSLLSFILNETRKFFLLFQWNRWVVVDIIKKITCFDFQLYWIEGKSVEEKEKQIYRNECMNKRKNGRHVWCGKWLGKKDIAKVSFIFIFRTSYIITFHGWIELPKEYDYISSYDRNDITRPSCQLLTFEIYNKNNADWARWKYLRLTHVHVT
jgi:hypothetical protein